MENDGKIQVELQEWMGSDASIANAAWTSTYDKDKRDDKYDDPEKVAALVPRLIKEGHSTPIESVVFRFWIRMPIYIDREHMTHRIGSHNGLSGRYRTMPDDFLPLPTDVIESMNRAFPGWGTCAESDYRQLCEQANTFYRRIVAEGKCMEQSGRLHPVTDDTAALRLQQGEKISNAEYKRIRETIRGCLPIANMVERTTIFNLRSFANYYRLRSNPNAAKEIQEVARLMLEAVEKANVCPLAIAALKEADWRI